MPNYYEILSVNPAAGPQELEAAIESQYNQVRRLTTHHDAGIVNQANQALLILEQARTTLLNPAKRAEYDVSLGIGIAGVADPELTNSSRAPAIANPSPLAGFNPPVQAQPPALANAWYCPQCQRPSPMGTLFCTNCRQTIGRICPNCQASYEAKANYCPRCGQSYESASRNAQLTEGIHQKKMQRISLASQAGSTSSPEVQFLEYLSVGGSGWAIFMAVTSVHFLLATLFRLVFSLFGYSLLQQPAMITIVSAFSVINVLLRWVLWIGILGLAVYLLRRKQMKLNPIALSAYGLLSLLALAFGGPNLYAQVFGNQGNAWLIFPALITGGLISAAWLLLRRYREPSAPLALRSSPLTNPLNVSFTRLLRFYEQSPLVVAGVGAGLSLFTLIFSAFSSVFSLLTAVSGLGAGAVLAVLSYRAYTMTEFETTSFLSQQESAKNNLAQLDAEITSLEQQKSALTANPT
jgi:hypothetical protein